MLPVQCPSGEATCRQLFDQQVERLVEGGWAAAAWKTRDDFRHWLAPLADLVCKVGEMDPGRIPFLIVVPHGVLSVENQMERLVVEGKRGFIADEVAGQLKNLDGIGGKPFPYLICGVDDGTTTVGRTSNACLTILCSSGRRSGLTLEEGVALATHHPQFLTDHDFALLGTQYGEKRGERDLYYLELWLSQCGPTINHHWPESRNERRGVPSCKRRLFLDR
ncbi:MAG: DUF5701 family protein [Patescibacteria group bacterium]|jgi:hypothetical protein